jgi:hypothetical protein
MLKARLPNAAPDRALLQRAFEQAQPGRTPTRNKKNSNGAGEISELPTYPVVRKAASDHRAALLVVHCFQ